MANKIVKGVFICFFGFFLMSQNAFASDIDLSNASLGINGFCANNAQYIAGMLDYNAYSLAVTYNFEREFLSTGYNLFSLDSVPCSDPWGISSIDIPIRSEYGWQTDGKYLNIDVVSNNYAFPFFNGAKLYGYDQGSYIPGYIDKRTYDVNLQYDSYTWLSGRDQAAAYYSMDFDEVTLMPGVPSVMYHLTFSIPYIEDNFTSNGVANIKIGTSQYLLNEDPHFVDFGESESPLFYIEDYQNYDDNMFWIKMSVTDEPLYDDNSSWQDDWSKVQYEAEQDAVNNISGLTPGDINTGDSSSATNLIGNINNIFNAIGNAPVGQTCTVPANFGHLDLGNINFCNGKENMPFVVTFGAYAFELIFVVGTSLVLISQVLSILDWARV